MITNNSFNNALKKADSEQNHMSQTTSKISIDWGFFKSIPMQDVLDLFSIETNGRGMFCCPAHNDKHPSAKISPKYNGWHCWSCQAGGSTLDLAKYALNCEVRDAALYLNQFFPGGVKDFVDDRITPPILTIEVCKLIGLKSNPYNAYQANVPKSGYSDPNIGEHVEFVNIRTEIEDEDRLAITDMVLAKLDDAIDRYGTVIREDAKSIAELKDASTDYDLAMKDLFTAENEAHSRVLGLLISKKDEFVSYKDRLTREAESPNAVASQDEVKAFFERILAEKNARQVQNRGDDGDVER